MAKERITKRLVDGLVAEGRHLFVWDSELSGFGIKVTPGGTKTYVAQYRTVGGRNGRAQRVTIGRHGVFTPETARTEARRLLASAVTGNDPAAAARRLSEMPTVSQLCDTYLLSGTSTKKASTLATDRGRIERHIKPLLGRKLISEIGRTDIRKFITDIANGKTAVDTKTKLRGRAIVKGGKGTATRTAGLLSGIFAYAVEAGYLESNPVHGVPRFPDKRNERFLALTEIGTLGKGLEAAEARGMDWRPIAIIRLLMLTGARRGEVVDLKWSEVDLPSRCLRLADSKTGQKTVLLNQSAVDLLQKVAEDHGKTSPYVFPSNAGDAPYSTLPRVWNGLRKELGLDGLRLHDLRHSFASLAVAQGASLPIVGALLGHANSSTTQRYAHLADDPVRAATELVGEAMATVLSGAKPGN